MGLDTFPLLCNHTCLLIYNNTVFKMKLQYQEMSEQKLAFVQAVSEQAAHCQIEDACRAVLYSIERNEELSLIQTDNFIINPVVSKWPLEKDVLFIVNGKQLSRHHDLILFKLVCKDVETDAVKSWAAVSSSNKRKCPSTRTLHDISELGTKEISSTLSSEGTNTDNSKITVSCTSSSAIMLDTPVLGVENIRGCQSPTSNNRITTLIRKHCTQIPTTKVQSNCSGFNRNQPIQNVMRNKIHESIFLSNNNEIQEPNPSRKNDSRLVNTNTSMNTVADLSSVSSQNECSQNINHGNINLKLPAQQSRKVIDCIQTQAAAVQSEVHENKTSDSNCQLRLSDKNHVQVGRDLSESSISGSQSNNADKELFNSEKSESRGAKKNKFVPKMTTRSKSKMHEEIVKNNRKYLMSHLTSKKLTNKADTVMIKNHKSSLKDKDRVSAVSKNDKYDSNKPSDVYNAGECSKSEIRDTGDRNYQADEIMNSKSLEMSDRNVVEISDDGSMLYESAKINNCGDVRPTSPAVAARLQNKKRKNHSSTEYSKYRTDQLHEGSSSSLSSESDDDRSSQQESSLSNSSTPAKLQKRIQNAHAVFRSCENNVNSSIGQGKQINVESNLDRHTNRAEGSSDSSFSGARARPRVNKKRKVKDSELRNRRRINHYNDSKISDHAGKHSGAERHEERSVRSNLQTATHSHRSVKDYNISNESRATKSSNNEVRNYIKRKADKKTKKKVDVDSDKEIVKNIDSKKIYLRTPDSFKRVTRSLSVSSSQQDSKLSSISRQSNSRGSSQSREMRSNITGRVPTSSKDGKKLLEAQQHLLKSKDGVWLFWK